LELVKRARGANEGTPLGDFLAQLTTEIDEDRETLRAIMKALEVGEDELKKIAGYVTEKFGRLKLNGELFSYSPLSRVVELEGLYLGVTGKRALWRVLHDLKEPRLAGFDLPSLLERAERQRTGIEEHRRAAARVAFAQSK
jgi:hypothetical protein